MTNTIILANKAKELKASKTLNGRIYRYLTKVNGQTDEEIEDATGLSLESVSRRRRELASIGLVKDSGKRKTSRSGRAVIVWESVNA